MGWRVFWLCGALKLLYGKWYQKVGTWFACQWQMNKIGNGTPNEDNIAVQCHSFSIGMSGLYYITNWFRLSVWLFVSFGTWIDDKHTETRYILCKPNAEQREWIEQAIDLHIHVVLWRLEIGDWRIRKQNDATWTKPNILLNQLQQQQGIKLKMFFVYGCVWISIMYNINLPFSTCTLTVSGFACDGEHVYLPESDILARCISKYDVVISPF